MEPHNGQERRNGFRLTDEEFSRIVLAAKDSLKKELLAEIGGSSIRALFKVLRWLVGAALISFAAWLGFRGPS